MPLLIISVVFFFQILSKVVAAHELTFAVKSWTLTQRMFIRILESNGTVGGRRISEMCVERHTLRPIGSFLTTVLLLHFY